MKRWMQTITGRFARLLIIGIFVALCIFATKATQSDALPVESGEGDSWLSWSADTQLGFVTGYLMGRSRGFGEGCDAYQGLVKPKPYKLSEHPFIKCVGLSPGFSKGAKFYQAQITDFYKSFPSDRSILFDDVVTKLSDSENMTPQQIHNWYQKHPPIRR